MILETKNLEKMMCLIKVQIAMFGYHFFQEDKRKKKEKEGAFEQVRWGPFHDMKLYESKQYDEIY